MNVKFDWNVNKNKNLININRYNICYNRFLFVFNE